MTFEEQLQIADGHRFQAQLGELVKQTGAKVIVETGTGVSSLFILKALDDANIDGKLHSIDRAQWYPHKIEHPKFNPIIAKSVDSILPTYQNFGPFDIFTADGDHEILCQTYEYNIAWAFLKPGGYLISDDVNWNQNGAWEKFLKENNLKDSLLGDAHYVQKPMNYGFAPAAKAVEVHELNLHLAQAAEVKWLAMGGKKHQAFEYD